MAEDLQRILECPMCFEVYDSSIRWPKLLPCQHTFCQPCLQLLDKNQRINCPQCRIDHISPPGGPKRLPNNFTMLSLIDLHGKTSTVPPALASTQDYQQQAKINDNVKNAIAGLAQKLQEKASDLSKIDSKRKQIEDKFLAIKSQLDTAFDVRSKELQTRREMLIKQLASLRQEELNFLEGQKASATQYLQKFQQDFAGLRESLLAQQRLPNEMELNNLLSMCRGYTQQIDKYALNLEQKDRNIVFNDPSKQQLVMSIGAYGCVKVISPSISPVTSSSGDTLNAIQGLAITNNSPQVQPSNQQFPGVANQNVPSLRPNMSDPSLATRLSPSTPSVPVNTSNSSINRSASGPSFNTQSTGSSQYMYPPTRVLPATQNAQRPGYTTSTPSSSTILQPTASSSSFGGWNSTSAAPDQQAIATNPSPHASRSGSPSHSVASFNAENSGGPRRRSLNPFLQESPNSLSQSQAISSLSTTISSTKPSNAPQVNTSGSTTSRSPLPPTRQASTSALPNPTQSSSRPAISKTRHASLDASSHSQQSVDLPQMTSITELNTSNHQNARNMSVDSASMFVDSVLDSPPPLPPRKGNKSYQRSASATSSSTSASSATGKWVQFDTLRNNSSPTKAKSVNIIGSGWFGGGFFEKPVGAVSLPDKLVAVVDERNHCVLVVSETGELVRTLGSKGNGAGQFQFPRGVCTNTAGHVIVSDWLNNRIQLWEPTGKFVRQFGVRGTGESNLNGPVGVVCDRSDNIYVCDYNNHCVKVFNAAGGFLRQIGKPGQGDGMFQSPSHIVISPGGELLITDAGKHCVQVFTQQGTFLYAVGQWGTGSGQLNCPTGITIDLQGYLYVANSGNHRIEVFNPSGSFAMSLGTQGKEEGQFDEPLGVATTEDGRLVICDSGNKRLQILLP